MAHGIGWHGTGGNHFCDYPGCRIRSTVNDKPLPAASSSKKKAAKHGGTATPGGSAAASSKSTPASLPSGYTVRPMLPTTKGKATAPRDPSPAPSDASSNGSERGGRVKMFCLECYDASNARPMNFHADCWNKWHSIDCITCT